MTIDVIRAGVILAIIAGSALATESWPGFRGAGNSTTEHGDLPVTWSETESIAWRAELTGQGQSSPVIAGGHVYVTSIAGGRKETLILEAFDLETGEAAWKKEFAATQTVPVSGMVSQGAPTPVADAAGVYAFFESGDLFALDHEGNLKWERRIVEEYGRFGGMHGIGTSLVNAPESLVLLIDHDGPSYLLCIDKETGKNRWKVDRNPRVSWSTPTIVEHDGERQIVISSNGILEAFRLEDGGRLWWLDGVEKNTVASPTQQGEIVVIGSSEPRNSLGVKLGGEGDISESHLAWRAVSVTSSFGSPLIHRDTVYFVNRAGALQATDLADGSLRWERRLPGSCWASPLAAGDRLYFFCKEGQTMVLEPAEDGSGAEELAVNELPVAEGDRAYGYAVAPGRIVIRTARQLTCIGGNPEGDPVSRN